MNESKNLYYIYKKKIEEGDSVEKERALEDAEEAHYMDSKLSSTHFSLLIRLYSNITGDLDILSNNDQ